MRSLLNRDIAAAPAGPPVTASAIIEEPSPHDPLPPGPAAQTTQASLYETTERLALALVKRAEDDLLARPKPGAAAPTVKELRDAVTFAMDILTKLPKLKPKEMEEDDRGVEILREAMADPAKIVDRLHANPKFIAALRLKGYLAPPERPNHRPTRTQQIDRDAYQERQREMGIEEGEDDGELRKMLKGKTEGATA